MKSKILLTLTFLLVAGFMVGFAYADNDDGGDATRQAVTINSLVVANNITGASKTIVTSNTAVVNATLIPIGSSDDLSGVVSGSEGSDRSSLLFTLSTSIPLSRVIIGTENVPNIEIDIYDEMVGAFPILVTESSFTCSACDDPGPGVTGAQTYIFQIDVDSGDLFIPFEDRDINVPRHSPEILAASTDGLELYLKVVNNNAPARSSRAPCWHI